MKNDELLKIFGIVDEIVYKNDENGYAVISLDVAGVFTVVVGNLPFIAVGESICAYGEYTEHPKFGEQFKCEYYEPHFENNTSSIHKFLSSGIIKGVGNATAKKIVDAFLEETLNIIERFPERLSEIQGISLQKAMSIHKDYLKKIEIQTVVSYFNKYGISPSIAVRVYNSLGGMAIKLCNQNPYIICERVEKIGFLAVDKMASEMGISKNSMDRIKAGITFELSTQALNGHTCFPKSSLLSNASKILEVDEIAIENAYISLLNENKLAIFKNDKEELVFLPQLYEAERYISARLQALDENKSEDLTNLIDIDKLSDIELAEEQKQAIQEALKSNVLIITGGPGTGKTTVINSLIKAFTSLNKKILLAAPTGRAAKRISELTKTDAKTIHRLLEITYHKGEKPEFARNEKNPLNCKVLIIDEMSMTDALLFEALLKAIKVGTKLIMVGDVDQLPPVGAGNVLKDMIHSNKINKVSFKKIFRQDNTSKIVENAHRILNGKEPIYNTDKTDFFFVASDDASKATQTINDLMLTRLPNFLNIDPSKIQILTPMRKTALGSKELNNSIKNVLNPISKNQIQKTANGYTFTKLDRVMQTKNDYEIEWYTKDGQNGEGIFNGDMGIITEIDPHNREMTILFDDEKIVQYDFLKLENLELAYAITVHKSQGSEFDAVIIPLVYGYSQLLTRNLLYTAVTRAKGFVAIVGKKECVLKMIENDIEQKRYTCLQDFL